MTPPDASCFHSLTPGAGPGRAPRFCRAGTEQEWRRCSLGLRVKSGVPRSAAECSPEKPSSSQCGWGLGRLDKGCTLLGRQHDRGEDTGLRPLEFQLLWNVSPHLPGLGAPREETGCENGAS